MNYHKIYDTLIERAKHRTLTVYCEEHHVIPRCVGGTDSPDNLVSLTPEEHYVCHQLLVKMHPGNDELVFAAMMMRPNRPNNKLYGWLKRKHQEAASRLFTGKGNSQFGTIWITNGTNDTKWKMSSSIPTGWTRGRKFHRVINRPRKVTNNISCPTCKKTFLQNKKSQHFCSVECANDRERSSLLENNFNLMFKIYKKTNSVNAAFKGAQISRNGYLAKKFLKLCADKT